MPASSGFTYVQPPSPTTQTPLNGADPRLSVGSYLNQQLGALSTGTGSQTGPVNSQNQIQQGLGQDPTVAINGAAQSSYDDIGRTNSNLMMLTQAKAQKDRAAAEAARAAQAQQGQVSPQSGSGGSVSVGQAYKPNGSLSNARNQALSTASSYLGSRYVLGGTSHQGIDCSGLVMAVYDQFGFGQYLNNHRADIQASRIPGVRTSISNLRPGDIVAWNDGSHIAIYAGNGQIIEAANDRIGTVKRNIWSNDVFGIALRLPGE